MTTLKHMPVGDALLTVWYDSDLGEWKGCWSGIWRGLYSESDDLELPGATSANGAMAMLHIEYIEWKNEVDGTAGLYNGGGMMTQYTRPLGRRWPGEHWPKKWEHLQDMFEVFYGGYGFAVGDLVTFEQVEARHTRSIVETRRYCGGTWIMVSVITGDCVRLMPVARFHHIEDKRSKEHVV